MFVLKSDKVVYVDVDDTLFHWKFDENLPQIEINCDGMTSLFNPIQTNIEYLKAHRIRGHRIIVWSLGGWQWAESVVKALKLEEYVDAVMSKPSWIIDDLQPEKWMPKASFGNQDPARERLKE